MNDIIQKNSKAFNEKYGMDLLQIYERILDAGDLNDSSCAFYDDMFSKAAAFAAGCRVNCDLLNIITGFADGSFVSILLDQAPHPSRFLVYEPDPASFAYLCTRKDISDIIRDDRLTLVIYDENDETRLIREIKEVMQPHNASHFTSMIVPAYNDFYMEIYKAVNDNVRDIAKMTKMDMNTITFHEDYLFRNEIYALSTLSDNSCIDILLERIETRVIPVIIVGAGPSLDKNAEILKRAKGKALIISAAHAARKLEKAGVITDMYAVLDPKDNDFMEKVRSREKLLLCSSKGDMRTQTGFRGHIVYFDFSRELFEQSKYSSLYGNEAHGGSVMTYLYAILRDAGFRRIIMAGMDLAYGDGGSTHAGNENTAAFEYKRGISVPGYYGGTVETRDDWYTFLKYFEEQIKENPAIEVIDATEGGALIEGSRQMSLEEAIETYCAKEYPVQNWLSELPAAFSKEEMKMFRTQMLLKAERISSLACYIEDALDSGNRIIHVLENGGNASDVEHVVLQRYDRAYQAIMESAEGTILLYYCAEAAGRYIEEALQNEASGDTRTKVTMEMELFRTLSAKLPELVEYMRETFGDS